MSARTQRSAEATQYRKLYKTARWQHIRSAQLRAHPLCAPCLRKGTVTIATVCHHLDPQTKLKPETFFAGPFESQCQPCHDGPTQQQERIGYSTEVGSDGLPVDPNHPFNR